MAPPLGYIIWGAPSTGKTDLALRLAAQLSLAGEDARVLHTDLLRVTLRHCGVEGLESDKVGDAEEYAQGARLPLEVHWATARREKYVLVVEGSLALGFVPVGGQVITLRGARRNEVDKVALRPDQPLRPEVFERAQRATEHAKAVEELSPEGVLSYDHHTPLQKIVSDILWRRAESLK